MLRSLLLLIALLTAAACSTPAAPAPQAVDPAPPPPTPSAVVIDQSCRSDADCTVKDVGNCCGYYPACVNVNSPTDPKGVQASCQARGMMSVCGFKEISGCSCVQGKCASNPPEAGTLRQPLQGDRQR
ncbi:hypothetical protein [Stenotrophomonas sp. SY1]|uniref:hypothetical protein n=1 Tax=Stenotrophomonas sp. SY1 TaxID=477235 RepID=UPI001E504D97|nr:hypothetical protein [Stenotrophomonas sp. SY1]MCD9086026.1 hypothetical protein [Stenotrophomonas sp. SY1]